MLSLKEAEPMTNFTLSVRVAISELKQLVVLHLLYATVAKVL